MTTTYTAEQCADFETKLEAARAAYHELLIGESAVEIGHANKRTVFAKADADKLAAYIRDLEAKCNACANVCARARPFRILPLG